MAAPRTLRIATRQSAQATMQAREVGDALCAAHAGLAVELVFVETLGDQRADVPLHTMGGQGVFVKEVQRAVLDGHADLAVHSAKDLPTVTTDGLEIVAFCERRDPADALVGRALSALAPGATVATGSVRRRAQLQVMRPDLHFVELRGNIQTRLGRIPVDGSVVMAVAALQILGLTDQVAQRFDVEDFVPSPGQGCVAVECRVDDVAVSSLVSSVDHAATRHAVEAERAFLSELGTGCSLPVGAHAVAGRLIGFLADPERAAEGSDEWWVRRSVSLSGDAAADLSTARSLARELQSLVGAAASDAGSSAT